MPGSDPFNGLDSSFAQNLQSFFAAAPSPLSIQSGYRTPERQQTLWNNALAKYGSPEAARRWVAPPGHSMHNQGMAADLGYGVGGLGKGDPALIDWAHQHAGNYGLTFPLANENWHIEPMGARNRSGQMPAQASGTVADAAALPAQAGALQPPVPQAGSKPHWMDYLDNQMANAPQAPPIDDPLQRMMAGQNPFGENPLRSMMMKAVTHLFA